MAHEIRHYLQTHVNERTCVSVGMCVCAFVCVFSCSDRSISNGIVTSNIGLKSIENIDRITRKWILIANFADKHFVVAGFYKVKNNRLIQVCCLC